MTDQSLERAKKYQGRKFIRTDHVESENLGCVTTALHCAACLTKYKE
jgi:hypothetical protein